MAVDYNDEKFSGNFVYLPKVGSSAQFEIDTLYETKEGNPRFHFIQKIKMVDPDGVELTAEKNLGYHIEAKLKNGKTLVVSSIAAFYNVFKKHEILDGETIFVEHPAKGEWIVTRK